MMIQSLQQHEGMLSGKGKKKETRRPTSATTSRSRGSTKLGHRWSGRELADEGEYSRSIRDLFSGATDLFTSNHIFTLKEDTTIDNELLLLRNMCQKKRQQQHQYRAQVDNNSIEATNEDADYEPHFCMSPNATKRNYEQQKAIVAHILEEIKTPIKSPQKSRKGNFASADSIISPLTVDSEIQSPAYQLSRSPIHEKEIHLTFEVEPPFSSSARMAGGTSLGSAERDLKSEVSSSNTTGVDRAPKMVERHASDDSITRLTQTTTPLSMTTASASVGCLTRDVAPKIPLRSSGKCN